MHRVVSGITVFRCNTTKHFMLSSNHPRNALGAHPSTSAVNVGDDHDKCLPRTRATPRFAFLEQHSTWKFSFRLTTSLHHLFIRLGKHCKRPVYVLPTAVASDILAFQLS